MGRLALACPLSARTGWRGQEGSGGRGPRALACLHPARTTERGGEGCRGASCPDAPLHGKGRAGERGRAAAACPRGRGGTEGEGAACPRAHPFHANGEGRRRGERRRRTLVPTPSVRMGREVRGERERWAARTGQGEPGVTARRGSGVPTRVPSTRHGHGGKGGEDGVPSCAAFPPERGGADRG
ncbi:hypothetical protein EDB85DRAFT_1959123, partial [Lactarius pseudohatsudake]